MNYNPTKTYLYIDYPYNINFMFHEETLIFDKDYCLIPQHVWNEFIDNINNDTDYFDERQYVIEKDNEIDEKLNSDYESDDSL